MSPHAFPPDRSAPAASADVPLVSKATGRLPGVPHAQSFAVRVRFASRAARASGLEVVTAEAWVAEPSEAGQLGPIVATGARDLLIAVDDAPDPDAALGVAIGALRESLLAFRVVTVAAPSCSRNASRAASGAARDARDALDRAALRRMR